MFFLPTLTMLKKYIVSFVFLTSVTVRFKFYITTFQCSLLCFYIILISIIDAHSNSMLFTFLFQ